MQHAGAGRQRQRIDARADQAGCAVEELSIRIDCDGDVVVDVARVAIRCLPWSAAVVDLRTDQPRAGRKKFFPRNMCQSIDEARRPQIGGDFQFIRVETSFIVQIIHSYSWAA